MSKEEEFVNLIHANQGLIYKITTIYAKEKAEQEDLYTTFSGFEWFR